MKTPAVFARRLSWLHLPGALLCALLQRAPAVPAALWVEEGALIAPLGALVRSMAAAAAALGTLHSLAGATQIVASTNSVNTTVGTAITPVVFVTNGAPTPAQSYLIMGVPPGLSVPGLNTATGVLNIANAQGSGQITGTPTLAGSFTMTIQAWEFAGAQGSFSNPIAILFTIAASGATGPPTIVSQPASLTTAVGETATFTVGVNANPGATYQWKKNGFAIAGATGASFTIAGALLSDAGNYVVEVTNPFGTVISAAAALTVISASSAPVILTQPVSQTVGAGATVLFTVTANGAPTPTYQWLRNGLAIPSATSATLMLTGAAVVAGNYTVVVANSSNSLTSNVARLIVLPTTNPGRLKNLSVLTRVTAAEPGFTVATVIGPADAAGSKPVLVRAAGPSLAPLGVAGVLADPTVTMFRNSSTFGANDDWGAVPGMAAVFARVGAFSFIGTNSKDAAFYSDATPTGSYSVQVAGAAGQTGSVLAEIYDAAASVSSTAPRLTNVSVLKTIPAGELLSAGFVIEGDTSLTVLIRAVGPGLAAVNVTTGVLADPKLELFNDKSVSLAVNDNWGGDANLVAAMKATGAFALPDTGSKDAVLLVTLPPGLYSAQVSGAGSAGGLALVEVYEVR